MKSFKLTYLLLIFSLSFAFGNSDTTIIAQKGILDLRGYDFSKAHSPLRLKGEWEFYWKKLLTPKDFAPRKIIPDSYSFVPEYWSKQPENYKNYPALGYATYHLVILSDKKVKNLKVYFPLANTSMKVWWNGRLLGTAGKVGKNKAEAIPSRSSICREVSLDSPKVDVIVQISNFHHREGGFFESPRLGTVKTTTRWLSLNLFISILLIGAALIMAFYHLGLFLMHQRNLAAFSFFLFSSILALRILITTQDLFGYLFPRSSFYLQYRLEYFTFYFIPPLTVFYFYEVFKDPFIKKIFYAFLAIAIIATGTLAFDTLFFSRLLFIYQMLYIVFIIISTYIIIKHLRKKSSGANALFVTYIIVFALSIHDILFYLRIVGPPLLTPLAIFILILGQSLVLAQIFTNAFKENLKLSQELEYKNLNLEKIVEERTYEIEQQKEQLEKQNNTLAEQTQALKLKDEMITSSLKYAATILQAIMPDPKILNKYFDNFVLFLPKDIVSGDGYWISDQPKDYIFIVLYDCTGHGVPAAFLSVISNYLFKNIIFENQIYEPNEILEKVDIKLKAFLERQNNDGLEATIVRIEKDKDEPQIKFATARMEVYYYNSRTRLITRHKGTRRALGYSSSARNSEVFTNFLITFKSNDAIYLLSDGYIDQGNKSHQRFGHKKFEELLIKIGNRPMWEQKTLLHENIIEYMEDTKQRDDILVIGIKNAPFVPPNTSPQVES